MDKYLIEGGKKLEGRVKVSGAKNSALALMPAAILNGGKSIITNIPAVNDIFTMNKLLQHLGADLSYDNHTLEINTKNLTNTEAPYEHVKKMRASVYVLGPLVARYGHAKVSLPGGCAWGPRPINLHLEAIKKLGAEVELESGYIVAKANKLVGDRIHFDISSVGATGNTLMAAVLARGTTLISNAAIEPEITLLAEYLIKMGAKISGIGTANLEIEGVDTLNDVEIENISDRIEAGTLLIAGMITNGCVELEYKNVSHLDAILARIEETGSKIEYTDYGLKVDSRNCELNAVDVTTSIYPGYPTDMQAQWSALMSIAKGTSTVTDTIYHDRFSHVPELNRLGANIQVTNNSAVIRGVKGLKGAKVMSTDLRASASLVLAGLAAEGETEVLRIYHIDRGYQKIEDKLTQLGANIKRVSSTEY
ncbi:MAG: UDP-N-acetylglucosamine 1-carboxyvinyltransferase [Melioribacteraceae bacterium]|nr:UDP-N-acetylglucosamine 1-carboxyvinyltransferase [Melioribacteraceae bacterium]